MATVVLDRVRKVYPGGVEAVRGFSLEIDDGEFVVLVGPSGCGKSTTLRMIAGLEEVTGGEVSIAGRVVNNVHPKDRDIAMVFQNYALYPHMSVYRNMAFALKLRRVPREEIDRRVRETARLLGIEELLDRKPRQLSGGQRQRVAVGRAIVREPKAFLFDEPLSNLDAKLRVTTRAELKALHMRLKTTTVYVTHDQEEAMTLGDRVVVMSDGLIQQVGSPLEVYRKPVNRFVAAFVGMPPMNFIDGELAGSGRGLEFVEKPAGGGDSGGGAMRLPLGPGLSDALSGRTGQPVVLGVRPQGLRERTGGSGAAVDLEVRVIEPLGDAMDVFGATPGGTPVIARVPAHGDLPLGGPRPFEIDLASAHFFEPGEFGVNLLVGAKSG
jgi:multiple sugar transport system ATP-binding protein